MKSLRITVIGGCGHVGLPIALAFGKKGSEVCIYDVDRAAVESLSAGKLPFLEKGGAEALGELLGSGRLRVTADPRSIADCDVAILTIGTPVDEHLNPNFPVVQRALDSLLGHFRDGQLLVLRSTVYPGISEKVQRYFRQHGKQVEVAFCPERIAEGQALEELETLPQIVSGFSPAAVERATALFRLLGPHVIVLEPLEAELTKLFTNAYRYIKFSIANQFYEIASDYGIDFYRILHAMTYRYPRAADFPRPGFTAGPCLFKDTMQLAAFNNNNFFLGHAAMLINEGLPNYIVEKLKERHPLGERRVGILGMAFKADSDDPRASLSYKLKKILEIEAAAVLCSDVYIRQPGFLPPEQLIAESDLVILAAAHREYRDLDFRGKPVVDVWNFYGRGGAIQ